MAMSSETLAERRLISCAKRAFGERLTSFLLCGLNEQGVVRRRTFIVNHKIGGEAEEVRINIFSDWPEGLPRGKQPLVLLALLKLWLSRGDAHSGIVAYSYEEIYEMLGWADTKKSLAIVDQAVLRYFELTYEPVKDSDVGNSESGLADSPKCRLVTSYRATDEDVCGCKSSRPIYRDVCFDSDLLNELKSKSLFGVDWRRARVV
jgi:hypothetical protein